MRNSVRQCTAMPTDCQILCERLEKELRSWAVLSCLPSSTHENGYTCIGTCKWKAERKVSFIRQHLTLVRQLSSTLFLFKIHNYFSKLTGRRGDRLTKKGNWNGYKRIQGGNGTKSKLVWDWVFNRKEIKSFEWESWNLCDLSNHTQRESRARDLREKLSSRYWAESWLLLTWDKGGRNSKEELQGGLLCLCHKAAGNHDFEEDSCLKELARSWASSSANVGESDCWGGEPLL